MARLFVAVWPPDAILDRVAALPRPHVHGLRWTLRHQWHVTLRFLGRVDDVASAASSLATMGSLPSTEAAIGPEVGRFGHRVLHVPVSGLGALASAVVTATAGVGEPPDERRFTGHLTLARTSKGAQVDLRRLAGGAITGAWNVGEMCLVESRLSPRGATYEVVARFGVG